jgi:hypothetical protein
MEACFAVTTFEVESEFKNDGALLAYDFCASSNLSFHSPGFAISPLRVLVTVTMF